MNRSLADGGGPLYGKPGKLLYTRRCPNEGNSVKRRQGKKPVPRRRRPYGIPPRLTRSWFAMMALTTGQISKSSLITTLARGRARQR
jgi:hypothetical protein